MNSADAIQIKITASREALEQTVLTVIEAFARQNLYLTERSKPRACRKPAINLFYVDLSFSPHTTISSISSLSAPATAPMLTENLSSIALPPPRAAFYLYREDPQNGYYSPVYERGDHLRYSDYQKACRKAQEVAAEKRAEIVIIDENDVECFRALAG